MSSPIANCTKPDPRLCRKHAKYYTGLSEFFDKTSVSSIQSTKQKPVRAQSSKEKIYPLHGDILNMTRKFETRLRGAYNPAQHQPMRNLTASDYYWTKPHGGLWVSPVDEEGKNRWDRFNYDRPEKDSILYEIKFRNDAKILVIDSREDYDLLLDNYAHTPNFVISDDEKPFVLTGVESPAKAVRMDGSGKRGLDWEGLAKEYDGLYLTQKGLNECGKYQDDEHPNDLSFHSWDLESAIIFHADAVEVKPKNS